MFLRLGCLLLRREDSIAKRRGGVNTTSSISSSDSEFVRTLKRFLRLSLPTTIPVLVLVLEGRGPPDKRFLCPGLVLLPLPLRLRNLLGGARIVDLENRFGLSLSFTRGAPLRDFSGSFICDDEVEG
ncbi:uncharacterized protein PHALS_02404 [Plasmopara halstedii]|uniref:Uncharacterized protein n=1 Tax=Plasmopara halstedii TaxID=4781 RepID=A0A0P1AVR4_PLAHL|nr:uncharacterized protein PHALS_02404 [Plasmopara halstedii]CEG46082.1 hypothetical protein PHALS_02404 [Plasmopara halstedii]|eukprot:XP_024582451.1 hypothetical protein PHALS_02404 [Plasmopara halstedii]